MKTRRSVCLGKHETIRFNVMVVGESGLGKSTFIKTFFDSYAEFRDENKVCPSIDKTLNIIEVGKITLFGNAGEVNVHMFDTPGYGDHIDNANCFGVIKSYLEERIVEWQCLAGQLMDEQSRQLSDSRIHCLLYFISPHRMKDIDKEFISKLSHIVPIVPVVAKADAMTIEERKKFLVDVSNALEDISRQVGFKVTYDFGNDPYESTAKSFIKIADACRTNISMTESAASNKDHPRNVRESNQSSVSYSNPKRGISFQVLNESQYGAAAAANEVTADQVSFDNSKSSINEDDTQSVISIDNPDETCEAQEPLYRARNVFAVISSSNRLRNYPWGDIDIDDERVSDFKRMQYLMLEKGEHIRGIRNDAHSKSEKLFTNTTFRIRNMPLFLKRSSISHYWPTILLSVLTLVVASVQYKSKSALLNLWLWLLGALLTLTFVPMIDAARGYRKYIFLRIDDECSFQKSMLHLLFMAVSFVGIALLWSDYQTIKNGNLNSVNSTHVPTSCDSNNGNVKRNSIVEKIYNWELFY